MRTLIAAFVAIAVLATGALAQSTDGAFAKLPRGEQKIVQALFEAQTQTVGQTTGTSTSTPLTRDQIAAKKGTDGGWGRVFKQMKDAGLLQDKNLGQVVQNYEHRHPETAKADIAKGKPDKMDKPAKPEKLEKPEKFEKPDKPERGR
jgi:hypothetical protein